jgi:hypothetical protein
MGKWDWVRGYKTIRREATEGIVSTSYTLNGLVRAGLIGQQRVARFYTKTGLADFAWRVFWPQAAARRQGYREAMTRARGFVIFSVSNQSRRLHLRNRELVIEEILALHEACWRECCEG